MQFSQQFHRFFKLGPATPLNSIKSAQPLRRGHPLPIAISLVLLMLEAIHDHGYDCDGFRHVGGDGDLSPRHFCLRCARDCRVDQISALLICQGHRKTLRSTRPVQSEETEPMCTSCQSWYGRHIAPYVVQPTRSHACDGAWCHLPRASSSRLASARALICLTTIP